MNGEFWAAIAMGVLGWLLQLAATFGYMKAREKAIDQKVAEFEARLRDLEKPERAISRAEYESRNRELVGRISEVARDVLRRRREG